MGYYSSYQQFFGMSPTLTEYGRLMAIIWDKDNVV